jgi:hypothetical protein
MRCAHCKARDVTVAHVRECSGVEVEVAPMTGVTCEGMGKPSPMWPASQKQIE